MPKELENIVSKLKAKLSGKKNPRTGKPYKEDEIYAIAQTVHKKKKESCEPKVIVTESFTTKEKADGEFLIEVDVLKVGTSRNRNKYLKEELENMPSMAGESITIDHSTSAKDMIGRVVEDYFDPEKQMRKSIGRITNKEAIQKIKDGTWREISAEVFHNPDKSEVIEEDGQEVNVLRELRGKGYSFVRYPGVDSAQVVDIMSESTTQTNNLINEIIKEEFKMADNVDNSKVIEALEKQVKDLAQKNEALSKEKSDILASIEKEKKNAIVESVKKLTDNYKEEELQAMNVETLTAIKKLVEKLQLKEDPEKKPKQEGFAVNGNETKESFDFKSVISDLQKEGYKVKSGLKGFEIEAI